VCVILADWLLCCPCFCWLEVNSPRFAENYNFKWLCVQSVVISIFNYIAHKYSWVANCSQLGGAKTVSTSFWVKLGGPPTLAVAHWLIYGSLDWLMAGQVTSAQHEPFKSKHTNKTYKGKQLSKHYQYAINVM